MTFLEKLFVFCVGFLGIVQLLVGSWQTFRKKNPFGLSGVFVLMGTFVWVDAIVVGIFWTGVTLLTYLLNTWTLFLLFIAVFWLIRSLGETLYWMLEQFSSQHRNPPSTLFFSKLFKGEEVWVVYQLFWQCISILSLVASLYLAFHL